MMDGKATRIRTGPNGRPIRQRTEGWFWDDTAEETFFDTLAASCNVTAAADAAGFCTPTVYRLRRLRPEFAARWEAALAQGYARLEMALVEAANDSVAGGEFDASRPIPKMTFDQAMNVLRAHKNEVNGTGRGPGRRVRPRKLEELREGILRKVEAIRRMAEDDVADETAGGVGDAAGRQALPQPLPQAGGENLVRPLPQAGGENLVGPLLQAGGENLVGPLLQAGEENLVGPLPQAGGENLGPRLKAGATNDRPRRTRSS